MSKSTIQSVAGIVMILCGLTLVNISISALSRENSPSLQRWVDLALGLFFGGYGVWLVIRERPKGGQA